MHGCTPANKTVHWTTSAAEASAAQYHGQTSERTVVQIKVLEFKGLVQLDTKLKGKQLLLPKRMRPMSSSSSTKEVVVVIV